MCAFIPQYFQITENKMHVLRAFIETFIYNIYMFVLYIFFEQFLFNILIEKSSTKVRVSRMGNYAFFECSSFIVIHCNTYRK